MLNYGCRSSKYIHWEQGNGKHGKFFIRNNIDDSEETVAPENLTKKTNIVEAMQKGAFFKYT